MYVSVAMTAGVCSVGGWGLGTGDWDGEWGNGDCLALGSVSCGCRGSVSPSHHQNRSAPSSKRPGCLLESLLCGNNRLNPGGRRHDRWVWGDVFFINRQSIVDARRTGEGEGRLGCGSVAGVVSLGARGHPAQPATAQDPRQVPDCAPPFTVWGPETAGESLRIC